MLLAGNHEGNGLVIHGDRALSYRIAQEISPMLSFVTDRKSFVKESLGVIIEPTLNPDMRPKKNSSSRLAKSGIFNQKKIWKNEVHPFHPIKFFGDLRMRDDHARDGRPNGSF